MSRKQEIIDAMFELFQGRRSCYAIKKLTKTGKVFLPARDNESDKDFPLTKEVFEKHLSGDTSIGIYLLDESDHVKCAVIDFDGKKGNPLSDALEVQTKTRTKYGLVSWIEKSQSGKGIHLWYFFDEKVASKDVRRVLGSCVPEPDVPLKERTSSFDRIFPVQDTARSMYGNLCAVPLNGPDMVKKDCTAFVKEDGTAYEEQSEIILKILRNRNVADSLRKVASTIATPNSSKQKNLKPKGLSGGFKLLSSYGCNWLKSAWERSEDLSEEEWWAAISQFAQLKNGQTIVHEFSKAYKGYSYSETQRKYESALKVNLPISTETVQEKFKGACGDTCACAELGCRYPYEVAAIPLYKLEMKKIGQFIDSNTLADKALAIAREVDEGKRLGFPWGYDILDDATELRPKNLIVVAARRSVGKTAVMIDVAVRGALTGIPQYIASLEMSHEELALRFLSNLAEVDQTLITTGKLDSILWEKLNAAADQLRKLPIFVDDTTKDLDRMLDNIGEKIYKYGKGNVWIDYLQLTQRRKGETQKDSVDRAVRGYKRMATILDVPVIALAQLNRQEESSESDEELDTWLKDTGTIEETADVVHYLRGKLGPGTLVRKWRIHKERHRASGINFKFDFFPSYFKFKPVGLWSIQQEEDSLGMYELGDEGLYKLGDGLEVVGNV